MKKQWVRVVCIMAGLMVMGSSFAVSAARPKTFDANGCLPLITEPDESAQGLIYCQGNSDVTMNQVSWVDGAQGKAVLFDGVNDYFRIPYAGLKLSDFTLSLWVNWAGASAVEGGSGLENQYIFSARGTNRYKQSLLLSPMEKTTAGESALRYCMQYNTTLWEMTHSQKKPLPQNSWQHLVLVGDEQKVALYLNGNLMAENLTMMGLSEMKLFQLYVGKGISAQGDGYFNGLMDNVYLYNRVLSADELTALGNSQRPTTTAPVTTTTSTDASEFVPDVDLTPDDSLPPIPSIVWMVSGTVAGLCLLFIVAVNIRYAVKKRAKRMTKSEE